MPTSKDDAAHSKPCPDIFGTALARLDGVEPSDAIVVGDTPYDAQAAQRSAVPFIGVRCGGWNELDLQPALAVYADPAELLANVERHIGNALQACS